MVIQWAELRKLYVVLIETKLQSKIFSIVKSIFGALEVNMPELEVVGGERCLDFRIFLDGLELFLQPFCHSC